MRNNKRGVVAKVLSIVIVGALLFGNIHSDVFATYTNVEAIEVPYEYVSEVNVDKSEVLVIESLPIEVATVEETKPNFEEATSTEDITEEKTTENEEVSTEEKTAENEEVTTEEITTEEITTEDEDSSTEDVTTKNEEVTSAPEEITTEEPTTVPKVEVPTKPGNNGESKEEADVVVVDKPKKNKMYTVKGIIYKVTGIKSVTVYSIKNKKMKNAKIPSTVKINGYTFKVTAIQKKAFKNAKKLTRVVIGKNVKKIGKEAFKGCKLLRSVQFKTAKLKSVGSGAFKNIHKKANIVVPSTKYIKYKSLLRKKGQSKTVKIRTI